jgi:arsenate reductase (thioredoxin)
MTTVAAGSSNPGMVQVLFVSAHNAARSLIAEALMNRLGAGRFEAHSAGFAPAEAISPYAMALLTRINYNTQLLSPKGVDMALSRWAPQFDFVIRLSPEQAQMNRLPQLPGNPAVIDWFLVDPMQLTKKTEIATAYEDMFNLLANRIDVVSRMKMDFLKGTRAADYIEGLGDPHMRKAS